VVLRKKKRKYDTANKDAIHMKLILAFEETLF